MANIQAFRGLRYDLSKVGALSDVIAPPYDVIKSGLQDELYERHPNNVVRLILNRGDDLTNGETIYERAAAHLKDWCRDGILKPETHPAVYVYHQTFEHDGQTVTRRGFMSRVRIEPFGQGKIYPHEQTHSKVKEDRFKLMHACKCNLSQIFSIYPDENNEAQGILESAIEDQTPITATDDHGVKHEMWLVEDVDAISRAAAVLGPKPLYIADGHHRYETACNIQKAIREQEDLAGDHPVDYVLMMNVSMHDEGMIVLPTHRLFRGIKPLTSSQFTEILGADFEVTNKGQGAAIAHDVWEEIVVEDRQEMMGFYCRADNTWVLARLSAHGEQSMKQIAPSKSDQWRSLGVAILHNLVIEKLLGCSDLPSPKYVHSIGEVVEGLQKGDEAGRDLTGQAGTGAPFELACLVMPATVEHVKAISEHGERMPAKSTYFYPKMLSGLVINPLA